MARATVAAVIPTKNVAEFIRGTLESLKFCDEVIIVDMHSTDDTRKICESYRNVRFFERQDYIYRNYNYGVEQAKSDWIIRLDSDERLSPELQREIAGILESGPTFDEYRAPAVTYLLGCGFGGTEDEIRTTVYRKTALHYLGQSEHEGLTSVSGKPVSHTMLKYPYHHFSMPNISTFIKKMDYYTERDYERANKASLIVGPPWKVALRVVRRYFHFYRVWKLKRFGYHGFMRAALTTMYYLVNDLKAWECKGDLKAHHVEVRAAYDEKLRTESLPFRD